MRNLVVFITFTFLSTIAFARGGEGGMGRWSIYGSYGLASVSPSDPNNILTGTNFTPALTKISTDTIITGGLGYMFHPRWEVFAFYDSQVASSKGNTTTPSGYSGIDMFANSLWAGLNYFLVGNERAGFYVGAGVGEPLWLHLRLTQGGSVGDFDGTKSVNFMAQAGLDVHIVRMLSLNILGGYQSLTSATLTNAAGQTLNNVGGTVGGTAAQFNLSGPFAKAGLKVMF